MEDSLKILLKNISTQIEINRDTVTSHIDNSIQAISREFREANKGMQIFVDANHEILCSKIDGTNMRIDIVNENEKKRNGSIGTNERAIAELRASCRKYDLHIRRIMFLKKYWWAFTIVLFLAVGTGSFLFHYIDIRETVEHTIGISIKEPVTENDIESNDIN